MLTPSQLHVFGVQLRHADAHTLVKTLLANGNRHSLAAAGRIFARLNHHSVAASIVPLTPHQRDAVLVSLRRPPVGLVELHGALAQDRLRRLAA